MSTDLEVQISSKLEARLRLSQSLIFPFLLGSSTLVRDNNITTIFTADLTQVSLLGIGEVIWTPAAFFLLSGGVQAGSGWKIPWGSGIGLTRPDDKNASLPRKRIIDGEAFDGVIWGAWGAVTLQFDLGVVIPGEWNHVLFRTRQEFRYSGYSRAGPGDSWIFENGDGDEQNGWNYHATYGFGYSMPRSPVLDTIAFVAELRKSLYNTPGGDLWGDGLGKWTFSGVLNFSFTPRLSTTLAVQMRTRYNYGTGYYEYDEYYYRDLQLANDNGRRLLFYRVALVLNFKLF